MGDGQCRCGAVTYALEAPVGDASCCHCRSCRRLTGSAFSAWGAVPAAAFRWIRGEETLSHYAPTPESLRAFCSVCGSLLATIHASEPGACFVSLGTLDDEAAVDLLYHQFAGSRAPWHAIASGLPCHAGWPDDGAP